MFDMSVSEALHLPTQSAKRPLHEALDGHCFCRLRNPAWLLQSADALQPALDSGSEGGTEHVLRGKAVGIGPCGHEARREQGPLHLLRLQIRVNTACMCVRGLRSKPDIADQINLRKNDHHRLAPARQGPLIIPGVDAPAVRPLECKSPGLTLK